MAASETGSADHHDGDSLRRPPSLVCMPAMREALPVAVRQRSISMPALLGRWLSLAARVPSEPNDQPDAQVAGPAWRLRQPVGAVPASTAVHAPSHVPNATGPLYVAVATEHGGSADICVSTQAADRRYDVSAGLHDCAAGVSVWVKKSRPGSEPPMLSALAGAGEDLLCRRRRGRPHLYTDGSLENDAHGDRLVGVARLRHMSVRADRRLPQIVHSPQNAPRAQSRFG